MLALAQRKPREYQNIEQAMERMREANPHLGAEMAHHLTIYGVRRNENGTFSWKYDNYTRATSPYLFNLKDAMEIWSRIRCPVQLVRGDASWAGDWERDGRLNAFRTSELQTIANAGHWVHHDQLAAFLATVHKFLNL
jgi:pimeloyl-ACP methyl ester carboxylesterase